jgi:hypothetical protein
MSVLSVGSVGIDTLSTVNNQEDQRNIQPAKKGLCESTCSPNWNKHISVCITSYFIPIPLVSLFDSYVIIL